MKYLPAALLCAFLAAPAQGAQISYEDCVALVKTAPDQSLKQAQEWNKAGGGAAAAHCVALSMVALERYSDAALVLERIANDPSSGSTDARAQILSQAGNAWILANEPEQGEEDLSRALVFAPGDIGLLFDRARARMLSKKYSAALEDINGVLLQVPSQGAALLLRAKIKSLSGDMAGAHADAQAALEDTRNDDATNAAAQAILDTP